MIKENIARIKASIGDSSGITIVAITKGMTLQQIREAQEAGIIDIGENRVQEALIKYNGLLTIDHRPPTIKWHMVGHLQTNKVKEAVKIFFLIHSVDSIRLAEEIDRQARENNKMQDVLIQVNTSQEATKSGFNPQNVISAIKEISAFKHINIKGLMTIGPIADDPEESRPCFKLLRELKDEINELRVTGHELRILSMGMTDDFRVAVEEGANMLRLGRAIFEG